MIKILNSENKTDKRAAEQIKNMMLKLWPDLEDDKNSNVQFHCSTQTPAGKTRDIDLTIILNFSEPKILKPTWIKNVGTNYSFLKEIQVKNLCMAVEVKPQDPKDIKIIDGNIFVEYNGHKKNVKEQSEKQKFSLQSSFGKDSPFVTRLIYLMSARENNFPKNIKPQFCACMRDSNFEDIIQIAMTQKAPLLKNNGRTAIFESGKELSIKNALDSDMFKTIEVSKLTKQKVDQITKLTSRLPNRKDWMKNLGKKQIILRGRGGTGKTYQMLSWAYEEYIENNKKSLFITYNHALAANIRILIDAMDKNKGGSGVEIITIQALMAKIANLIDFELRFDKERKKYASDLLDIYNEIAEDPLSPIEDVSYSEFWLDILENKIDDELASLLSVDYVFVDEGQDVKPAEASIIQLIFGLNKIVVSYGINQYTRDFFNIDYEELDFDWSIRKKGNFPENLVARHTLRTVMRLSENLNAFVELLNDKLGIEDLDVRPSDQFLGGKVIVYEGNLMQDKKTTSEIFNNAYEEGCSNSDILFCVQSQKGRYEDLKDYCKEQQIPVWDGTLEEIRMEHIPKADEVRVVQYQSSRGLEGWSVVCLDFEHFWGKIYTHVIDKLDVFASSSKSKSNELLKRQIINWLMIPLTRPMKTLYIQIESRYSEIGKVLYEMHEELDGIIEWKRENLK